MSLAIALSRSRGRVSLLARKARQATRPPGHRTSASRREGNPQASPNHAGPVRQCVRLHASRSAELEQEKRTPAGAARVLLLVITRARSSCACLANSSLTTVSRRCGQAAPQIRLQGDGGSLVALLLGLLDDGETGHRRRRSVGGIGKEGAAYDALGFGSEYPWPIPCCPRLQCCCPPRCPLRRWFQRYGWRRGRWAVAQ